MKLRVLNGFTARIGAVLMLCGTLLLMLWNCDELHPPVRKAMAGAAPELAPDPGPEAFVPMSGSIPRPIWDEMADTVQSNCESFGGRLRVWKRGDWIQFMCRVTPRTRDAPLIPPESAPLPGPPTRRQGA